MTTINHISLNHTANYTMYRAMLRSYQTLIGLFLILSFIGLIAFYIMFLNDTTILILSITSLLLGVILVVLASRGVVVAPPVLRFRKH